MKKTVVFGSESLINDPQQVESFIDNKSIGTQVLDRRVHGSSFRHTMTRFVEYTTSSQYHKDDVFIVIVPPGRRSPIVAESIMKPQWAVLYTPDMVLGDDGGSASKKMIDSIFDGIDAGARVHYDEFKEFYRGYYKWYGVSQIVAEQFMRIRHLASLGNEILIIPETENILFDWFHRDASNETIAMMNKVMNEIDTLSNLTIVHLDKN